MLSRKAKYSLQALSVLARKQGQGPILISDIAVSEAIPIKFLESILLELKKHGILQSKKGKGGGYFLARPAKTIILGHVIRIIDGPLAPLPCVSQTAYMACEECNENSCNIREVMKEVRDATARILDGTTLAAFIAMGNKKHSKHGK